MSRSLPSVEIARKFVDESFDPHVPVLALRWSDAETAAERLWELPDGFSILGSPPERFALRVCRHSTDSYAVSVLWGRTQLRWPVVSRLDLLGSCLAPLLEAIGLDLWSILEQPIPSALMHRWAA